LADGTTGNPNFYVSFQYKCTLAGTLKIGFPGTPLYFEQQLAVTDEYQYLELSGKWDLNGDFTLSFDGDMFLYDLSLRNDKLQDFALLTSSKFTQTDASISAIVQQVNTIKNTIANAGWLTESDKVKIWAMLTFGETGTTLESLFEVTANGIFLKSDHIDLTGKVSFNSLSSDFQSTYANDLSNAQLAAKNGIAQQLGFTNYAQLVENALVGKTLISGGYINSQLIDVVTLLANKAVIAKGIFTGSIATPYTTLDVTGVVNINLDEVFNYDFIGMGQAYLNLPSDNKYVGTEVNISVSHSITRVPSVSPVITCTTGGAFGYSSVNYPLHYNDNATRVRCFKAGNYRFKCISAGLWEFSNAHELFSDDQLMNVDTTGEISNGIDTTVLIFSGSVDASNWKPIKTFISDSTSDTSLSMPSSPYVGKEVRVRKRNSGNCKVYPNGHSIYANGDQGTNYVLIENNDMCIFIFDGIYWSMNKLGI